MSAASGTHASAAPARPIGLRQDGFALPPGRVASVMLAALWTFGIAYWHRNIVMDDPWITFRYAANVLAGHGWAFNPGEPLEGYSNFLWTIASMVPIAAGVEPLGAMRALSALAALWILWALAVRTPRGGEGPGGTAWAPLLLAACWPFAAWIGGGLETIGHAALLLGFAMATGRALAEPTKARGAAAGALAGALAMSRPEGAMFMAVLPLCLLRARQRGARIAMAAALGVAVAVLAGYSAWRLHTFGTLVANTVSAKVGGGVLPSVIAGLRYALAWLPGPALVVLPLAAAALLRARRDAASHADRDPVLSVAAACLLLQVAFAVAVGGDWMPGYRFLVPAMPLAALLAGVALAGWNRWLAAMAVAAALLAAPVQAYFDRGGGPAIGMRLARWISSRQPLVATLQVIGRDLRAMGSPEDTIALSEAGVVPYLSRMRVIDMLGLVDREIAALPGGLHQKHDADSVLRRAPRFVLLGFTETPEGLRPTWAADGEVSVHPDFMRHYAERRRWPRTMTDGRQPQPGVMVLYERKPPVTAD